MLGLAEAPHGPGLAVWRGRAKDLDALDGQHGRKDDEASGKAGQWNPRNSPGQHPRPAGCAGLRYLLLAETLAEALAVRLAAVQAF